MNISDKTDFEPSHETLMRWLATRKEPHLVGNIQIPGYFSDEGNEADTWWFLLGGVFGEMVGVCSLVWGGFEQGGTFLLLSILGVIMFIFCDFFFAIKLHRKKGEECKIRSQILTAEGADAGTLRGFENKLKEGNFYDFLLQVGIIVVALLKIIGIFVLGIFNIIIIYVPFGVYYLFVAYVHIKHTGYFFAYFLTGRSIKKEHIQWANSSPSAGAARPFAPLTRQQIIATDTPLRSIANNQPIRHNPHEIQVDLQNNPNNYIIITKGVLTDDDIKGLINGQDDNNKIALFKACRKLQLEY